MKSISKIISRTTAAWGSVGKNVILAIKRTSKIELLFYFSLFLLMSIVAAKYDPNYVEVEGFQQSKELVVKKDNDIYDTFYVNIYDDLVHCSSKNAFEIGTIDKFCKPTEKSALLDIGSGTGHHVNEFREKKIDAKGIDISPAMIKKSKTTFPKHSSSYILGNALDTMRFPGNSFTHITCFYFTIYYMQDKRKFFSNCMHWLIPGGNLIIHLVDKDKFNPILEAGDPFVLVSPQKYADKRITTTEVVFNDFNYKSDFDLKDSGDKAIFREKFKDRKNGSVRKHELTLHMQDHNTILQIAKDSGFIVKGKADMMECNYDHQSLYILQKPT